MMRLPEIQAGLAGAGWGRGAALVLFLTPVSPLPISSRCLCYHVGQVTTQKCGFSREARERRDTGLQLEDLASYRCGFLVVFLGSAAGEALGSPSYIRSHGQQNDKVGAPRPAEG